MKNGQSIRIEFMDYEIRSAVLYQGTQILQEATASYGEPLTLRIQDDGSFQVTNGTLYDYTTNQWETYSAGVLVANSSSSIVTFQSVSGESVAGINTVSHKYVEGSEVAVHIGVDSYLSSQVRAGSTSAASTLWGTILPYLNDVQQDAGNLLNTLNINRLDFANGVDSVVDKMFDALKTEPTGNLLLDIPGYQNNASLEITKLVLKGFVDVIRIGDNLDDLWDESTQTWQALNDGNYSDAAKHALGMGKHTLIEGLRLIQLIPLAGGSIKLIKSGTTQVVEEILEHGDEAARLVKRLLTESDEAATVTLTAIMKNPAAKKLVLEHLDVDAVAHLFKKGHIGIDDFQFVKFKTGSDLDRLIEVAQTQRKSGGKLTTLLGHFDGGTSKYVNEADINILNFDDTGLLYDDILEIDLAWLDRAISRGDDIILVTENVQQYRPDGNPTFFYQELKHLKANGYRQIGNYMKKVID